MITRIKSNLNLDQIQSRQLFKEYILLTIGTFILIVGNYFFKFPNHFTFGGVTGVAVLLAKALPMSVNTITFVLNMIFLVLGFICLGRSFGTKTIYVTVLFSFGLTLFEKFFPLTGTLTGQPILELFFAILLPSISAAIFFSHDASSGGTDIIAMILKDKLHIDTSKALMIADVLVVILAFFTYGTTVGLYSVIGWFSKSLVTEYYLSDMHMNKCLTIICDNEEPICDFIENNLKKSATIYEATGAYSRTPKHVIMTALSLPQAQILCNQIKTLDPKAFVMVTKSSEIHGKGFLPL